MDQFSTKMPPRITERRGKPELQPLERPPSLMSSTSSHRVHPQPSISSLDSSNSIPTRSNTSDVTSIPATPTEPHWYQPRFVDGDNYRSSSLDGEEYRGLGYNVNDLAQQAAAVRLSEKLQAASECAEFTSARFACRVHRNCLDAEHTFSVPPTPPSHVGEEFSDELHFLEQDVEGLSFDEETFCSEPPTPVSPSIQPTLSRSRRAALLNKVLPPRFRENIKRRMSGQTNQTNQAHAPFITNSAASNSRPRTPPPADSDRLDYFGSLLAQESNSPQQPAPDPQFILPISLNSPRQRDHVYSPLQSPRTQSLSVTTDLFPDIYEQIIGNEVVRSPLQLPSISPLTSPTLTIPLKSLNMLSPLRPEDQSIPSIDPTSTVPSRKVSSPIDPMSSDTISQLIAEMEQDDEAYSFMIHRMISHGWSSGDEIKNLEVQREECLKKWQRKIAGAKRLLDGLSKRGLSTPFQFPERSVKSMDTVWSDNGIISLGTSYIPAGPDASLSRTCLQ